MVTIRGTKRVLGLRLVMVVLLTALLAGCGGTRPAVPVAPAAGAPWA